MVFFKRFLIDGFLTDQTLLFNILYQIRADAIKNDYIGRMIFLLFQKSLFFASFWSLYTTCFIAPGKDSFNYPLDFTDHNVVSITQAKEIWMRQFQVLSIYL